MNNIVIFGAASAIAEATAKRLATKKTTFILVDKNDQALQAVADNLRVRYEATVFPITADLSQTDGHQNIISEILQNMPLIDVALIAYGTLPNQEATQKSAATTLQELNINAISIISLLTILATHFETQKKGTIAVISSVAGDRGRKSNYIYGTAKGALTIFLQGLRNRLSSENVHVLTIKPGFVDTPMTTSFKKGLLWAKPDTIAKGIVTAIRKEKDVVYLPWFWRYIMLIIKLIPEKIFKRLSL